MWIGGLAAYFMFHLLVFGWYLPKSRLQPLDRPMIWFNGWFHAVVTLLAIVLLLASGFMFYLSYGWLVFAPLGLVFLSFLLFVQAGRYKLNEVIKKAVVIDFEMNARGRPRAEINKVIMAAIFGEDDAGIGVGPNFDIRELIKIGILARLGFYDVHADFERMFTNPSSVGASEKIDALIDYWELRVKGSSRHIPAHRV